MTIGYQFLIYIFLIEDFCVFPGKRFGLLQSKIGLLTIIKNYKVSLADKTKPGMNFDPWELMLSKVGGVWINLKKIEKQPQEVK